MGEIENESSIRRCKVSLKTVSNAVLSSEDSKLKSSFDELLSVFLKGTCPHGCFRSLPPMIGNGDYVDLLKLFSVVKEKGGFEAVSRSGLWGEVGLLYGVCPTFGYISKSMGAVDRISNLPPNITDHILQCLPLRDAIRTSTLSTRWRFKWVLLPQLILDHPFIDSVFSSEVVDVAMHEYSNIVNNILVCHDGPIHKFVIDIPCFTKDADISRWFHFASRKLIKELVSESLDDSKKLPPWMFSCVEFSHLTHLTLLNWFIESVPMTFRGFPCLISLKLHLDEWCTKQANKLGIIVSKCPLLENLNIKIVDGESCLTIHAPKLQNLVVSGNLSGIFLEETAMIKMLTLDVMLGHERDLMMEFFSCLPVVEKLIVGYHFWCDDSNYDPFHHLVNNNVPNKMIELKHLVLNGMLDSQYDYLLCLLNMAPKLQILEINVVSTVANGVVGDCCLEHLKSVKLRFPRVHISSDGSELQLMKTILSSSPVLEIMTIEANMSRSEKFNISKELWGSRRASANALIIFDITQRY